jgi:hypothetical protein
MVAVGASCAKGTTYMGIGGSGAEGGSGPTSSSSASSSGSSTTSSSSSTSSSGTVSSSSSTSSSGSGCPDTPCKVTSPQCGCAAGEACTVQSGAVTCGQAGPDLEGQACGTSATDLCQAGLLCVTASPTVGQCLAFCDSDSDCQAPGGICLLTLDNGMGGSIPNVTICTPNCDPLTNAGCPATSMCDLRRESMGLMRWLTLCDPAGTKTKGQVCDPTANDCAPKFTCINNGTNNVCLQYCNVNAPNCPAGQTCGALQDQNFQPITLGNVTFGVCE